MENIGPQKESWNKKRIFAALFLIVALVMSGYLLKAKVLSQNSSPSDYSKAVKGTTSVKEEEAKEQKQEQELNINVQKIVRERIESLKQDVRGLNIVEIASSSPQVQKILNDIKSLEQYPANQAKEICRQICGL